MYRAGTTPEQFANPPVLAYVGGPGSEQRFDKFMNLNDSLLKRTTSQQKRRKASHSGNDSASNSQPRRNRRSANRAHNFSFDQIDGPADRNDYRFKKEMMIDNIRNSKARIRSKCFNCRRNMILNPSYHFLWVMSVGFGCLIPCATSLAIIYREFYHKQNQNIGV